MTAVDLQIENAFWRFSLSIYSAPGVADECLAAQDRYDVDVNVLLFCAWLAHTRGLVLTADDLVEIETLVGVWQQDVIKPLRAVRRALKGRQEEAIDGFRRRIKQDEIEAEKIEQAMLFTHAAARWPARAEVASDDSVTRGLEVALHSRGYEGRGGAALPLQALRAAVRSLPRAE